MGTHLWCNMHRCIESYRDNPYCWMYILLVMLGLFGGLCVIDICIYCNSSIDSYHSLQHIMLVDFLNLIHLIISLHAVTCTICKSWYSLGQKLALNYWGFHHLHNINKVEVPALGLNQSLGYEV